MRSSMATASMTTASPTVSGVRSRNSDADLFRGEGTRNTALITHAALLRAVNHPLTAPITVALVNGNDPRGRFRPSYRPTSFWCCSRQ